MKWLKASLARTDDAHVSEGSGAAHRRQARERRVRATLPCWRRRVATAGSGFTVPASAFTPPPKIASAIVRLTDSAAPYPHLDALERVTAAAFGQRRKMLRAALRSLTPMLNRCCAQRT
ncbi:MAG: rRNA adenine N-6-methyltransferase family protein [Hyphomonadaceae bacterium]